ncbi:MULTISPECIES: aspartate-semialdehyde dehydrogenase [Psychrilyobacter]|uniref:Aspartate-semialdehyde dehydrogenase n=1 Tax=Psychrilyobacter piezotolerans TaxID=2293438 RepID=A0ABX9KHX1_9FUSO|nr:MULTISPECIES: aspartate-semialdehyde dehydrogenase [Psychrilyobacter]MCS5420660.1 aspartate-semialdehyde dehydrogenase [Psychrilyobacter sp. S5]NDI77834.1 aspartate-semialdehyde dehydrogenase [Psychrilyobacter piezotolerans]RDE62312.1 aspartate-semialdehyde dehydrogenase [Psychrilyobacter sp. S5]REI41410.1 aspartate-semialdehyde dehydrogenase [Psychrilyobacter piezotolerans]
MKKYNVAIAGATGLVGQTFLQVLEERKFPIKNLYLMASSRSAGEIINYRGKNIIVEELNENSFDKEIDIALFSAGGEVSKKFSPIAASKGVVVVDNSSAFRMVEGVPLIVPEVNPEEVWSHNGIIANPNCSTIQSVVPLKVLDEKYKIKRIVYSTYQAVSGSGFAGIKDLENGLKGKAPENYPHPIAGNCLPHIDVFLENGNTKEEQKMIDETKKILSKDIRVTATCVRVPVLHSHSVSMNLEFEKQFDIEQVRKDLAGVKGLIVEDDIKENIYPMAVNSKGKDEVFVGRVRRDESVENGLNLWVVADNIRKGAATNTVQIAELLVAGNKGGNL